MPRPRMRPHFELEVPAATTLLSRLSEELAAADSPCVGQVFRRHAVLHMRKEATHLWSPYLNLELREVSGTTTLFGRFGPHPNVWTGFMAIYGLLLMLGLTGAVGGLAQLSLDASPWALALMPASLLMALFIYGAVFIGQGMSSEQMYELRSFVDRVALPLSAPHQ